MTRSFNKQSEFEQCLGAIFGFDAALVVISES